MTRISQYEKNEDGTFSGPNAFNRFEYNMVSKGNHFVALSLNKVNDICIYDNHDRHVHYIPKNGYIVLEWMDPE
jgi:hypothetical protein